MVVIHEQDGKRLVHVSTNMSADEWRHVQCAFLDVTTDMMNGNLSSNGKNALATLMQLLKDMMLSEAQTVSGLESPLPKKLT